MTKTDYSKNLVKPLQESSADVVSNSGTNSDKQPTAAKRLICKKSAVIPEYVAKPSDISIKEFKSDLLGIANSPNLNPQERNTRLQNFVHVSVRDMLRDWCKLYELIDNPILVSNSTFGGIGKITIISHYGLTDEITSIVRSVYGSGAVPPQLNVFAMIYYNVHEKCTNVKLEVRYKTLKRQWACRYFAQPQTFVDIVWNWILHLRAEMIMPAFRKAFIRYITDLHQAENRCHLLSTFLNKPDDQIA